MDWHPELRAKDLCPVQKTPQLSAILRFPQDDIASQCVFCPLKASSLPPTGDQAWG
ncbi:MAG: hypothetical protein NPIRA03_01220 [Nitrospirales bacterium]|nr:MAG: hypothetical protein NPIRA03_01220 [Nitrospirales bacterium]